MPSGVHNHKFNILMININDICKFLPLPLVHTMTFLMEARMACIWWCGKKLFVVFAFGAGGGVKAAVIGNFSQHDDSTSLTTSIIFLMATFV